MRDWNSTRRTTCRRSPTGTIYECSHHRADLGTYHDVMCVDVENRQDELTGPLLHANHERGSTERAEHARCDYRIAEFPCLQVSSQAAPCPYDSLLPLTLSTNPRDISSNMMGDELLGGESLIDLLQRN